MHKGQVEDSSGAISQWQTVEVINHKWEDMSCSSQIQPLNKIWKLGGKKLHNIF